MRFSSFSSVLLFTTSADAFSSNHVRPQRTTTMTRLSATSANKNSISRKQLLQSLISGAAIVTATSVAVPEPAFADVSDGNALPQGAAQFNRVVRLKSDLPGVKKRLQSGDDIDKKEWDNIGKFLRTIYATGDDLKAVAAGIGDKSRQQQATDDIAQIRKYAQAGDIPVNKQDATSLIAVLDKIIGFLDDFFDALSDVPDEL